MLFHSSVAIAVLHRGCCPEEMGGHLQAYPSTSSNLFEHCSSTSPSIRPKPTQPRMLCYLWPQLLHRQLLSSLGFCQLPNPASGATAVAMQRHRLHYVLRVAEASVLICAIRLVMLPYGLLAIELGGDDACAMGASPRGGTSTVLAFSRPLMPLIGAVLRSGSPSSGGGRFRPSLSFRLGLAGMFGQP